MDQRTFIDRRLGRRSVIRGAAVGAGAVGLGLSGAGRFGSMAWAQEASPAASSFDPEACYQSFPGAEIVQYEKLADPPYNIALSNSYIGNVWRTQMIKMAKAYAVSPDVADLINEFQVNTADGVVVVSFDTTVQADPPDPSLDLGVTVNEDQVEMGRRWAQWLVEQTGGEGKILMVNGVQGTGVDQERRQGASEVWNANPGIEPIEVVGDWDPGKAQSVTATALAANPDFAGVWCQGGTDGVVRAFLDAGVPLVPVAGEAENGFRKQMLEYKDQFQGYSIGQTPGLVAVSMRAALSLLMGEPVPKAVSVPLPEVKTDELEPGVNFFPDAPDNFFTATSVPACGVNLTFEEVDAQQV